MPTNLPPIAFIATADQDFLDTKAPVVAVKRGEAGFVPIFSRMSADDLNFAMGVTPAQREAMLVGSMFGFDVPGANPALYDHNGNLRRSA